MIAHVYVFNERSELVLDFNIALTGFDIQSLSMASVLRGNLPSTPINRRTSRRQDSDQVLPTATSASATRAATVYPTRGRLPPRAARPSSGHGVWTTRSRRRSIRPGPFRDGLPVPGPRLARHDQGHRRTLRRRRRHDHEPDPRLHHDRPRQLLQPLQPVRPARTTPTTRSAWRTTSWATTSSRRAPESARSASRLSRSRPMPRSPTRPPRRPRVGRTFRDAGRSIAAT